MLSGTAGTTSVTSAVRLVTRSPAAQRRLGFGARGVDREDVVESRQLEDPADRRVGVAPEHEPERHVALTRAAQSADEHAEDGRVDERRLVQVDDHGAALAQIVQAGAELRRGGEVVLTGHRDHRPLAVDGHSSVDASAARQRSAPLKGVSSWLQRISDGTYLQFGRSSNRPTGVSCFPQRAERRRRRRSANPNCGVTASGGARRRRCGRRPSRGRRPRGFRRRP